MKTKLFFFGIMMICMQIIYAQEGQTQQPPAKETQNAQEQQQDHKKQKQIADAEKKVSQCKGKLADANLKQDKLQADLESGKAKGKLSPVDIAKYESKIADQKLTILKAEENLQNAQEKLDKLK